MGHAQLHDTGDFLAETNAAGAMNATAHLFHADERAHILVEHHALFFVVTRGRTAITHRQVLQLAFAALIADGAVQRVVDEQKLHHRLLRLGGAFGLGAHHHALGHRGGTSRQGLGCFFHVNQTHAAVGCNGQLLVIAEVGNERSHLLGRMHDHAAFGDFDLLAVNFDFNHLASSDQT